MSVDAGWFLCHPCHVHFFFFLFLLSTRSDGVASSCAGGDEDDFSSDGEGPTLNIVKKREKQANTDQVDGSPNGSSNLTPVKQRFAFVLLILS